MGVSQLMSVPYALYAKTAGNASGGSDTSNTNEIQSLTKTGSSIQLSHGGGTVIDEVIDADADSTNELQTLSINNHDIHISQGNTITIPDNVIDADADSTNEIQSISKTGSQIELSHMGGSITDEVDDADADATNELQLLSISSDTLYLSKGNFVVSANINNRTSFAFRSLYNDRKHYSPPQVVIHYTLGNRLDGTNLWTTTGKYANWETTLLQ
jgi:hypothetical protein